MRELTKRLLRDRRGATLVEYALLACLIGLACLSAVSQFVQVTDNMWEDTANKTSTSTKSAAADLR